MLVTTALRAEGGGSWELKFNLAKRGNFLLSDKPCPDETMRARAMEEDTDIFLWSP